jgi:ABC-type transporter Mla MlaB component
MILMITTEKGVSLKGVFQASQLSKLENQMMDYIALSSEVFEVDLAQVTGGSSAFVALLLSCLRYAQIAGKTLLFTNPSATLKGLVELSNLDDLIFKVS